MPPTPSLWDVALQYGGQGVIVFICIVALWKFILRQWKRDDEQSALIVRLAENAQRVVENNTLALEKLAERQAALERELRGRPCMAQRN